MRRPLVVMFGLLAFAGLVIGATVSPYEGRWLKGFSGIPGIEDRIEDDARDLLDGLGIEGALVSADGSDLTIETAADLPGSLQNDLRGIDGVGSVDFRIGGGSTDLVDGGTDDAASDGDTGSGDQSDQGEGDTGDTADTDDADSAGSLQIDFGGDTIDMSGTVQSAEGRDALLRSAQRLVGDANVADEIEINDSIPDDFTVVSTVASVVRRLGEWYDEAELELDGTDLTIVGVPAPGADLVRAQQVVGQLAQRAGLDASLDARSADEPATDDTGGSETADPATDDDGATDTDTTGGTDTGDAQAVADVLAGLDFSAITFEPGTAILTDQAVVSLDDIAAQLLELPRVPIGVVGHTSTEGDPDVNLLLSDDRARAVREYLVSRGVATSQLTASGVGGSQPLQDNSTAEGRAANERIEFVVAEGNN